jgi:hypothetical protein
LHHREGEAFAANDHTFPEARRANASPLPILTG